MQHARPNRLRRAFVFAALATLLGVFSLTLSQCTMVGDNLTGVELNKGRPTTCIKMCNDLFALAYDQEQKHHDQSMLLCEADCAALPPGDQQACIAARQACKDAEAVRHAAAKDSLGDAKIQCQEDCAHSQGTGSAG